MPLIIGVLVAVFLVTLIGLFVVGLVKVLWPLVVFLIQAMIVVAAIGFLFDWIMNIKNKHKKDSPD